MQQRRHQTAKSLSCLLGHRYGFALHYTSNRLALHEFNDTLIEAIPGYTICPIALER